MLNLTTWFCFSLLSNLTLSPLFPLKGAHSRKLNLKPPNYPPTSLHLKGHLNDKQTGGMVFNSSACDAAKLEWLYQFCCPLV